MSKNRFISKPEISQELITRKRLIDVLKNNETKQLILLSAPAGYGKTTLLLQYISELVPESYIWIQATESVYSPYFIISLILKALHNIGIQNDESLSVFLEVLDKELINNTGQLEEVLEQFIDIIYNITFENFKLIIDDYQLYEQNDDKNKITLLLRKLTDFKIEGLTIVLSSREEFNLPDSKLEAKRNLLRLSTRDIIFTNQEVKQVAFQNYDISLSDDQLEVLESNVNGWISALHLIFQKGKDWQKKLEAVKLNDIYKYYYEDTFYVFSDNIKKFIFVTNLLDSFNTEDSDRILKINNSKEYISFIIKKKVFIEIYQDEFGKEHYSYQKLLKEFLMNYYDSFDLLTYLNIAEFYLLKKDIQRYIYFLLKGKACDVAVFYFKEQIIKCLSENDLNLYNECVTIFKKELLDNDFIEYHKVRLQLFQGNTGYFNPEKIFSLNSNYITDLDKDLLYAEYLFYNNENKKAQLQLTKIIKNNELGVLYNYVSYLIARNYFRMGVKYYNNALSVCMNEINNEIDNPFKAELFGLIGNINKDMGKILLAIEYYEKATLYSNNNIKYLKQKSSLIELYSMIGRYEKSFIYLNELSAYNKDNTISSLYNIILRANFFFYDHIGDYDNAIVSLNESLRNPESQNNQILLMTKYLDLSNEYWYDKKYSEAKNMVELSESIYAKLNQKNEYFELILSYFRYYISENSSDYKLTELALLNVIDWHVNNKIEKPLGYLLFNISGLYLKYYDIKSSLHYLNESLIKLQNFGYYSFLENMFVHSRKIFDLALSENLSKKLIYDIGKRVMRRIELPFISEDYRFKLKQNLIKLTDLHLLAFGRTEIKLRGETIPEDKWIRKKSKILLVYLMSDPERIHSKDEIMDIFFDDMPADKADVAYHSTIYNIRTALKIYEIKTDKPKRSKDKTFDYNPQYIMYEDKTLKLNPDFYYRADNIELEKLYEKSKLPAISAEEKIAHSINAISLYKGDFLPGYYESWCEELRVKYKNMFITLCEELIRQLENNGRYDEVIKYSELLLKEDKLNDAAHVSIINAYVMTGNVNMAKSRYEVMLKIFDEELGEKPQQKTLEKIKLILNEVKDL